MPKITAIKPQKRQTRVNIYLDHKFGFGIDLENFVKLGLKVGQEYEPQALNEIIKKAEFQKTADKLINFALVRPRSEREFRDWFRRKEVHESLHSELLSKLKRLKLLDDYAFAKWWIEQRTEFRPRGSRALKSELDQKGVNRKIIDEVLRQDPVDEVTAARTVYEKAKYKWARFDEQTQKQKASEFLARKGFGWDVIRKVIKIDYQDS